MIKHARSHPATVTVEKRDDALRIEIADDGTGGADTSKGTGLLGLRDRAEADGGTLVVISPPGRGTRDHRDAAARRRLTKRHRLQRSSCLCSS